jgi:HD-GYP domain-containing protein (c-di-GMP phosphodiesterase class II)
MPPARIVLSEVLASLSYALDLTDGQPEGHTMRSCLIGMRLGTELGLDTEARSALYYALLLKDAGCSSNAARLCQLFGTDDRTLKPEMRLVDWQDRVALAAAAFKLSAFGKGTPDKLKQFLGIARNGGVMAETMLIRCERGADIALRLGFPQQTALAIRHLDEHWNGAGNPDGLLQGAIPLTSRIANLAQTVEVFHHAQGLPAALKMVRKRRSSWFDPGLADIILSWSSDLEWWDRLTHCDLQAEVVAEEPSSYTRWVGDEGLDTIAKAFADIIDAKSPYTSSHSRNVASYALAIARGMGVDLQGQRRIYRAGLLHDIGKLGVSNAILDKAGPLTDEERAVVERHPVYSWEILSRVPAFRDFAWPAALHHERIDGRGYPWRISGTRLDLTARILAVADVYEALTADRPYRAGLTWEQSSGILWKGRGTSFDPMVLDALEGCVRSDAMMNGLEPLVAA